MNLQHIDLENLKTTTLNVRKKKAKSVDDLVPSIRASGILQPLLVRPNCEGFEVVAGQRRLYALQTLAKENLAEPVPCIVMDKGDDAAAIEASLAENLARLPIDEIDQYKAFGALVKKGMDAADIAAHFGISERLVHQRLAIGNLITPILNAYRKDEIEPSTLRILTMASKKQQKEWHSQFKEQGQYSAPRGYQLKQWLFGGASVPVENALFDLADYQGVITSDLFGEDRYFADSQLFWENQNTAIAKAKDAYLAKGWAEVNILEKGEYFASYDYVDTAKKDGGKIYIEVSNDGQVTCYEGQLSRKEAQRQLKAQNGESSEALPSRPELSQPMQSYLDLHRHSAVRAELLKHGDIALRLAVAQMIAGSELWSVYADAQNPKSEAIAESLDKNPSQAAFSEARKAVSEHFGIKNKADKTLVNCKDGLGKSHNVHEIFSKLIALDDKTVLQILTFVTAETLPCGSEMVEALGDMLSVDMGKSWTPDEAFFTLLRDKETINAMVKHIGGKQAADSRITETGKKQKAYITEKLNDEKSKDWLPRYMRFPMQAYTKRGGIRAIEHFKSIRKHYR